MLLHRYRLTGLLIAILFLTACSMPIPTSGISVWIDVPLDGLEIPDVQTIKIEGHAASPGSISRIEIWINGALQETINDPPTESDMASFHTAWSPAAPGVYTIQVIAFSADGSASAPDSARVTFGEAAPTSGCPTPVGGGATPVSCTTPGVTDSPTSSPTVTDTPTSPPGAVIQFWADPAEIEAGACTTIRWHVQNVQRVIFGGIDQPLDGSYQDCLCASQRYTLNVVHMDGSEEKRSVEIAVSGSCATQTSPPPQDTTPPPAPSLFVPASGLSITCEASQSLVWLPVQDESGVTEYQVQVQRHSGDNNWQPAPGGQLSVADKSTSIPVECGWYYRWRVRARDGAGNLGPWSGWSSFTVTLS
jgi:hypothetical protein